VPHELGQGRNTDGNKNLTIWTQELPSQFWKRCRRYVGTKEECEILQGLIWDKWPMIYRQNKSGSTDIVEIKGNALNRKFFGAERASDYAEQLKAEIAYDQSFASTPV
jgi:hypothetical protein